MMTIKDIKKMHRAEIAAVNERYNEIIKSMKESCKHKKWSRLSAMNLYQCEDCEYIATQPFERDNRL